MIKNPELLLAGSILLIGFMAFIFLEFNDEFSQASVNTPGQFSIPQKSNLDMPDSTKTLTLPADVSASPFGLVTDQSYVNHDKQSISAHDKNTDAAIELSLEQEPRVKQSVSTEKDISLTYKISKQWKAVSNDELRNRVVLGDNLASQILSDRLLSDLSQTKGSALRQKMVEELKTLLNQSISNGNGQAAGAYALFAKIEGNGLDEIAWLIVGEKLNDQFSRHALKNSLRYAQFNEREKQDALGRAQQLMTSIKK